MGTNVAHLLADLCIYSYESEFIQQLQRAKKTKQCHSFNSIFCYIDDMLSTNNPKFCAYLEQKRIYSSDIENKDSSDSLIL